ncbi:hypothetical protein RHMOL_Rhmol06G0002600 [Rhododendron molle]|uniref:Uncharacterized protein n=1 Tax=Rhododendron molle TaxID=49168 RepID=A0ACC0N794_RHOML|nr:hypothetical protein RHMOL_Rhmol06G0002600 [Rhododendron molle]
MACAITRVACACAFHKPEPKSGTDPARDSPTSYKLPRQYETAIDQFEISLKLSNTSQSSTLHAKIPILLRYSTDPRSFMAEISGGGGGNGGDDASGGEQPRIDGKMTEEAQIDNQIVVGVSSSVGATVSSGGGDGGGHAAEAGEGGERRAPVEEGRTPMDHLANLIVGAHQLEVTLEIMTIQLMEKPDYIVMILAEIRDFKIVQHHTPTPMEDDPWFPVMFPILCAFRGFFGALPPMENFMYGEEETGDEKVAHEVTKEVDSGSKDEPEEVEVLAYL